MKIEMFIAYLPQPGRKPGGVSVYVHRLAGRLVAAGHQVRVTSFSRAPTAATYAHRQLKPEAFALARVPRMTLVPLMLNAVSWEGDVLHLHGDDWFFARRPLPTVRTFYGSARDEARTAQRVRRRASQWATFGLEIVASRLATATYGLVPGDGRAYRVRGPLGFGVDLRVAAHDASRRTAHPTVLFVGTWHGRKRGHLLAERFATVRRARPDVELIMVCDDAPPDASATIVRSPTDEALRELYERSWVFCLPSAYEGLGIPLLEAMAAGTPCIATPSVGPAHVLADGRGVLTADRDLATAIIDLLDDEARRQSIATRAAAGLGQFTWDATLAAHLGAYEHAVSAARLTR